MPKLLTLDGDYTLAVIQRRHLEHELLCTDLGGYFDHVWTVHALVGASPDEPPESSLGPPTITVLTPRHTVIEGRVAHSKSLVRVPLLNFLLAQCILMVRLVRLAHKEGVSVVRAGDPYYLGLLGYVIAKLNRLPLVIRVNGNYDAIYASTGALAYPRLFRRRRIEKWVERHVLPQADLVACGNQDNLEYAVANGARRGRSTLFRIGNIISPEHHAEPSSRLDVRTELDLEDRPFLLFVGRLQIVKHPEDVLDVLHHAREREPRLAAVVVGDGAMRDDLEARARSLGLEDHVRFAGPRDQPWVARAYTSASVVLAPVSGRGLVEGALSGTPIVGYDFEWQSELLTDGSTALLVPHRDTRQMADAACRLLQDPDLAEALATKARKHTLYMMDPARLIAHERQSYDGLFGRSEQSHQNGPGRQESPMHQRPS